MPDKSCGNDVFGYLQSTGQFSVRSERQSRQRRYSADGFVIKGALYVVRNWSFADHRRVIELAKASKSLEEVARTLKRKPESVRKVSMKLGVKFKASVKKSDP